MRWLHVLACVGMMSHHAVELAPGVGLVWQPQLGLVGAIIGWSVLFAGWLTAATSSAPAADAFLALMAGFSIVGAVVHYFMWPVRFRGGILPWLEEAEGLPARMMPAYNIVLSAWLLTGTLAVALDVPGLYRLIALTPLLAIKPLIASAKHHFSWIRRQARTHPAWWNRAFAGGQ